MVEGELQTGGQSLYVGGIAVVGQSRSGDYIDIVANVREHILDIECHTVVHGGTCWLELYEAVVRHLIIIVVSRFHIAVSWHNGLNPGRIFRAVSIGSDLVHNLADFTDASLAFGFNDFCLEESLTLVNFPVLNLHGNAITARHIRIAGKDTIQRVVVLVVVQIVGSPCVFA